MCMPGRICEIISGGRQGQRAFVSNTQEKQFTDKGKVHAFFFDKENHAILDNGRHMNGLIAEERLKNIGFYD